MKFSEVELALSILELYFGRGGIGWEIGTRLRNWPGGFNSVAVQSFASQAQDARVHSVEAQGQGETWHLFLTISMLDFA